MTNEQYLAAQLDTALETKQRWYLHSLRLAQKVANLETRLTGMTALWAITFAVLIILAWTK